MGRSKYPVIHRYLNGETHQMVKHLISIHEYIVYEKGDGVN